MIFILPLTFISPKIEGTSGSTPKTHTKTHDDVSKIA